MFRLFYSLILIAVSLALGANNIEVTNIVLSNQNVGAGTTTIQFDLTWENSWRVSVGPGNYDAAWVFAKFRVGGGAWRHATISGTGAPVPGANVDVADQLGAFVYRSTDGSGFADFQDVEIVWDYGANNVDPNAVVDVQVFAVEMVYVPVGSYRLGTGRGGFSEENEAGEFRTPGVVIPILYSSYQVNSEAAITVGAGSGELTYSVDVPGSNSGDQAGPIPALFPKGFAAFYCMKYEVSQAQYVAFFNTLTQTQRENLDVTGTDGKNTDGVATRNGIAWDGTGNATTTFPDVPVNFVNNQMVLAYLDWSGLRPMTELEFEKAGRGPVVGVNNEFAWGSANIHATDYNYLSEGQPDEGISNPGVGTGNAVYTETNGTPTGPKRCGILAASAVNANREETGGSYYGIMELSGNLYERLISVGNPEGRAFNGSHGDGQLSSNGSHNVASWPSPDAGIGYRGGSYTNGSNFIRLSDRYDAANTITVGNGRLGFRGVRTAN